MLSIERSTGDTGPFEQRLALLKQVATFADLPTQAVTELARHLRDEEYSAGSVLIAEGDVGQHMYLIVAGTVEVSTANQGSPIPLQTLGAGDVVGEIALLTPDARRTATVTALTHLQVLSLHASVFQQLLADHPAARATLAAAAQRTLIFKFLKQASPFTVLEQSQVRWLAEHVETISIPAGTNVITQGESGDACYLLRSGRVQVLVREEDGAERCLETHGPGRLFGETALLTDAPRNATVQAIEPCNLLVLHRAVLLQAMRADQAARKFIFDLVSLRDRPRRIPGVLVYHRTTSEGETITILKDPQRGAYYQLSPEGWFVWQRLDGRHNHRDLVLDYFTMHKTFAPHAISEIVGGLAAARFVVGTRLSHAVLQRRSQRTGWERVVGLSRQLLNWRIATHNVDGTVTSLYRVGVHLLYTWPAQVVLAAIAFGGLVTFALTASRVSLAVLELPGQIHLLWFFLPALLAGVLVHEAGHAFTTKAFGHEVLGAGIGWHWFAPMAFVDTSDMWLAGRWPRIAVSLAGPYTNLITGGVCSLFAWLARDPVVTAALWQFALACYLIVLRNLNPLLESDGYYILIDWLERPNMRRHAFAWLRNELPGTLRVPGRLRGHGLDLAYGLAAIVYIVLVVVLMLASYRLLVQDWLTRMLSPIVAAALTWALAGAIILLYAAGIASELRGRRGTPPT